MLTHVRRRLDELMSSELDPARTAAAVALGVFLSFSPFLGLQIVLGLGAAFAFRLSRVAVLLGLCANLPWIMVPWYALTTAAAAAALGTSTGISAELATGLFSVPIFNPAFWSRTGALASGLFWPFLLGPTVGALLLATASYFLTLRMLVVKRRRFDGARPAAAASAWPAGDAEERAADRHVHEAERTRLES